MTAEKLSAALEISHDMLALVDERDWHAIARLQQKRTALLANLPVNPEDSESWHRLAELNQRLVARLQAVQSSAISNIAKEQRHAKVAMVYSAE